MNFCGIALLAYDTDMIEESISSFVGMCDEMLVGLDENRETWSGKQYELPTEIVPKLLAISDKVKIVEDFYYVPGLSPLDNDTRERNMLSARSLDSDWYVSFDSDEVLVNMEAFRDFLINECPPNKCVMGHGVNVYKELEDSYLVVGRGGQVDLVPMPLATDIPESFIAARYTRQERVMSPGVVLHFTWARSEAELRKKFANWGHRDDFDTNQHLEMWLQANEATAHKYKNFHPMTPESWPELVVVKKNELKSIAAKLAKVDQMQVGAR